jgi:hypothetical protein
MSLLSKEKQIDSSERGTLPVAVLALATDAPHKLGAGLDCVLLDDRSSHQRADEPTGGPGVKHQRPTERRSGRADLHPRPQWFLGVGTGSLGMRGQRARREEAIRAEWVAGWC